MVAPTAQRKSRPPCAVCAQRVSFALAMAAAYRSCVGGRTVGPREATTWARLQRQSVVELAAVLAAAERCRG